MQRVSCPLLALTSFLALGSAAAAQPLIMPVLTPRSAVRIAAGQPIQTPTESQLFPDVGTTFQPFGDRQYGAATKLYSVRLFGFPDCRTPEEKKAKVSRLAGTSDICAETLAFAVNIDSQMVHAVKNSITAAREYLVSRKGSPLSLSIPSKQWTTQKPDVRQTWVAAQGYFTGRWIPVPGENGDSSGAAGVGATIELHSDFEAAEVAAGDEDAVVYPGFVYLSVSPSVNIPFGQALKDLAFKSGDGTALWGVDVRGGFSLRGKQPISVSINATWTPNGFEASNKSIGISLSKLLSP